jgi:hypothetical protein
MTSRGNTLRGLALVFGAALVLVGCGNSADGTPTATGASVTAGSKTTAPKSADPSSALWNPCDLPDSAISATGLDPATKEKDVAGVKFEGWKVCNWRAAARWYDLTILSGTPTLQDAQQRTDYEGFTPRAVGSHQAVEFRTAGDSKQLDCYIAVEVPRGTVMFKVLTRYSQGKQGDPCTEVQRHVDDLVKYLPGS